MATTKTVNVTTGKVLHYTVKKEGFKPVTGSKLITGAETININMVPNESTDGAYVFGDRIGGVATFVGYFDSVDPDTQATQKYAYFVLDAKYRWHGAWVGNVDGLSVSQNYDEIYNSKESATFRNNFIFDNYTPSPSSYQPIYYSRNPNGQSLIVTVDGVPYSPVLPNYYELKQIWNNRIALDANDPTLADGSGTLSLTNWYGNNSYGVWSCMSYQTFQGWDVAPNGNAGTYHAYYDTRFNLGVYPIFEIPVN